MNRRAFSIGILGWVAVTAMPGTALAAKSVKVTSSLGRARVNVGEGVFFEVEIEVEGGGSSSLQFPELDGVEIIERGTSSGTSISIMGGRRNASRTSTHTFVLVPARAGDYPLDVRVEVDGKEYRAASVPVLQVAGGSEEEQPPPSPADGRRPTRAAGEIFLWPTVDRVRVYVGEQINYEFEVWERTDGEVSMRAMPTFQDFWSEELPVGQVRRDQVDGVGYRVHPSLRRALFPQRAGKLTVGGGEVQVRYGRPFGLFGAPGRSRPQEAITGPEIEVEVQPLPAAGQPADFLANNVGRYSLRAEVDRAALAVGDALTLKLTVEGEGNVRLVEPDGWPVLDGMRRYEPKEEAPKVELEGGRLRGSKRYEFLVIAERPGALQIPAHELHFFDPEKGEYELARTEAIAVEVSGTAATRAGSTASPGEPAAGEDPGAGTTDPLTEVFALPALPRSRVDVPWLDHRRWRIAVSTVPVLLGGGWLASRLLRRVGPDAAARARAERRAVREQQLARASQAVDGGEGFHAAVAALLHGAASQRAGESGEGLTRDRLLALLATHEVVAAELEELRSLLDACDAARFGAAADDVASRRDILRRARELVDRAAWRIR